MRRILSVVGIIMLLVLLAAPAAAQPGPDEVIVTPPAGPRGTEHLIEFSGTPDETVTLEIIFDGQVVFVTQVTVNANGIGRIGINSEASDPIGVYEIVVTRSDGSTATGTLEITADDADEPDDESPEESADQEQERPEVSTEQPVAARITAGEVVSGALDEATPAAYYSFRASAGDTITVTLESPDFDAFLTLQTAQGETLISDDDGGGGLDAAINDYELPFDGVYLVVATSARYAETGAFASSGTYTLSLTGTLTAPEVVQFGDTLTGELTAERPQATYVFEGEAGQLVTIVMESDELDPFVALLDQNGDELATDDDSAGDFDAQITSFVLPEDGEYTVVATTFTYYYNQAPAEGAFTISIESGLGGNALVYGDVVEGEYANAAAPDAYLFEGRAGDVVTIAMESEDFDALLVLLDPDGEEVARDDDSGQGLNALIADFELPESGAYTILATSFNNDANNSALDGAYTLTLSGEPTTEVVQEPDEVPADRVLAYGDSVEETLDEAETGVAFTFEGAAGDVITIAVTSDDFDPYVILQDADGEELASDDDSGQRLNAQIEAFELPEDGIYTIIVTSLGNLSNGTPITGEYTLTLFEGDVVPVVQSGVTPIVYGDVVEGSFDNASEGARYSFTGNAGDVVTIVMYSENFDPYLSLRDLDGFELAADDDSAGELNAMISEFELPADGTYIIIATSFGNVVNEDNITGTYLLSLSSGEVPIVVDSDEPVEEVSPTELIRVGDTVEAELVNSSAGGTYLLQGTAGDVITILLESDDFDAYLVVYGQDGAQITADDDGGEGLNALIQGLELPANGTYRIIVTSFESFTTGTPTTGEFTLSVIAGDEVPVVVESEGDQIAYGDTIEGEFEDSEAGTMYVFEGSAGDVVTITLESPDFDPYLLLLNEDGDEIASDDDGAGDLNSRIAAFELPEDGTYTIVVRSYENQFGGNPITGEYTLTLESEDEAVVVEPEEGQIAYGDTVEGTLDDSEAGVTYTFEGEAGDVVTIRLESDDFDPFLVLLDEDGEEVTVDDDGAGSLNAQISGFELPEDGTYTIVVTSFSNRSSGTPITGDYVLTLAAGDEPVVVQSDGDEIAYGDIIEGELSNNAEGVRYTFEGEMGDEVSITLESDDFDAYLILYDEDGNELTFNDDFGGSTDSRISGLLPYSGSYTILVTSFNSVTTGVGVSGEYTLTLEGDGQQVVTGEIEIAGQINSGDSRSNSVNNSMGIGYTFEGRAGDVVRIALTSNDFDPYLILLDPDGREIAYDDDGGGGLNSQIRNFELPEDGTYTIVVSSFLTQADGQSFSGEFTLSFDLESGGEPLVVTITDGGEIESEETVEGELGGDVQAVGYTFEGEEGDYVTIILDSPDFDPFVSLLDEDGNEIASDDDSGGNFNSRIDSFQLPEGGEYTIVVSSFSARFVGERVSGIYAVRLIISDEPTPEPVISGQIAYGDSVESSLGGDVQQAEYTFEGRAGDTVTITLSSDDFDPFLILLDPNGDEIAVDDDGAGALNSRISDFQLPTNGTYTIIASSYEYQFGGGASGDFVLELEGETGGIVTVDEGEIAFGQEVSGALTPDVPFVDYRFSGQAGDRVIIAMQSAEFDTYLYLYNADNLNTPITQDDDSGGNLNSQIGPFTLPASGEYVIRASSYSRGGAGAFTLRLSRITEQPIEFGETVEAELTQAEQMLYFTFDAQEGDVITVHVEAESGLDTTATLISPEGFTLAEDDDGGLGYNPEINSVVVSSDGEYAVIITPYVAGDTGTVRVTVERGDLPSLDDGPQTVRLLDKRPVQIVTFVGEPGETVRLRVRALNPVSNETYVTVFQGDQRIAFAAFGQVTQLTFDFVIPASGRVTVRVEDITLNAVQVEITLERSPGD